MRVALLWRVAVLGALSSAIGSTALAKETTVVKVRGLDVGAEALIDEGRWRSETFQRLLADVAESDLIVYVTRTAMDPARSGALRFVGAGEGVRFLLIELNEAHDDDLNAPRGRMAGIATLAHELQHALEVAAAGTVRDAQSFDAYFRAIGAADADAVDTHAARQTGAQVYFEMTGRRGP